MAYTLASSLRSRGSVNAEFFVYSSGVYYIALDNSEFWACESTAEEVALAREYGLATTCPVQARAMWENHVANAYGVDYTAYAFRFLTQKGV